MGCLTVKCNRVGNGIRAQCSRLGNGLDVSCNRLGNGLDVSCNRIGNGLDVSCNRIGKGLTVDASLVCSVNLSFYVRVSKKYLFLTPENDNTDYVDVISNVKWDIH